jgi:ATP-dependent Clp protease protease subunit
MFNQYYNHDLIKYNKKPKRKLSPKLDDDHDPLEALKLLMEPQSFSDKDKNHIYFYSQVDQYSCLDLNRKINQINKDLLMYAIEYDCEPPSIYLHINSPGGCLFSAFSTIDTIINSKIPIISIIEGAAASAATIISMVCHKRYITANSFMLIHQLSTGSEGKYEEIKENYLNDTKLMELLYKLYLEHTTMSIKKIKEVLKHDIWWDANECVLNGLVDGIHVGNHLNISILNRHNGTVFKSDKIYKSKKSNTSIPLIEYSDPVDDIISKPSKKSKK